MVKMKISEIKGHHEVSGTFRVLYPFTETKDKYGKCQIVIIVDPESEVGDKSAKLELRNELIGTLKKDDMIELKNYWSRPGIRNVEGKQEFQAWVTKGTKGQLVRQ